MVASKNHTGLEYLVQKVAIWLLIGVLVVECFGFYRNCGFMQQRACHAYVCCVVGVAPWYAVLIRACVQSCQSSAFMHQFSSHLERIWAAGEAVCALPTSPPGGTRSPWWCV
jgi:hypothetical protein